MEGMALAAETRAESGMQPARRDVPLLRQRVPLEPHLTDCRQLAAVADLVEAGGLAPGVDPWRRHAGGQDCGKFLLRVFQLAVGQRAVR